jgi:hypothetical protein
MWQGRIPLLVFMQEIQKSPEIPLLTVQFLRLEITKIDGAMSSGLVPCSHCACKQFTNRKSSIKSPCHPFYVGGHYQSKPSMDLSKEAMAIGAKVPSELAEVKDVKSPSLLVISLLSLSVKKQKLVKPDKCEAIAV